MSKSASLFNEPLKQFQRTLARKLDPKQNAMYLHKEVAIRMAGRLDDIKRSTFTNVLGIGPASQLVCEEASEEKIGKFSLLSLPTAKMPNEAFDACISNLYLHWVNDLPKLMADINSTLMPDGLFITSVFGLDSLSELRECLQLAEVERVGGFSPHISPMMRMEDMGNLLSQTGFNLVTVDYESITVQYPSMLDLMDDLFLMGESAALTAPSRTCLGKETLMAADALYKGKYTFNFNFYACINL